MTFSVVPYDMQQLKHLAIFILVTQRLASLFLMLAFYVDSEVFSRIGKGHPAIPGLFKTALIIRHTKRSMAMAFSFLALACIILSYAGVTIMIFQGLRYLVT